MRQTEQKKSSEHSEQDKQQNSFRNHTRGGIQDTTLTIAVQALQRGVPLESLPPGMVLELSSRIGNDALVSMLSRQTRNIENPDCTLPVGKTDAHAFEVTHTEVDEAAPPVWDSMPVISMGDMTNGGTVIA